MPGEADALYRLLAHADATIAKTFDARVAVSGDKPFLIWEGQRISYRDAHERIKGFAGGIGSIAAKSGRHHVVSYLNNCPDALWAWLGTAYAGGIYIPINRNHRGALLEDLLRRAAPDVIVTDAAGAEVIADKGDYLLLVTGGSDLDRFSDPEAFRPAAIDPGDTAAILYTSGTTGRAKATRLTHNQYCRNAARLVEAFDLRESDVFHNWLPLFHLAGQVHMTMTAVIAGGTVALFPGFSRSRFRSDVSETGATILCGFEAILNFIWSLPPEEGEAGGSLRVGIFAGIPDTLRRPFEDRFGMVLGDNYGMTEIDPITVPGPATPAGSCGIASRDVEIAILDDQDNSVSAGIVGQIAIRPRAPHIMTSGYEDDDAATLSAWRNLWFHTGDLGMLDAAGYLHFKGRLSGYIRRRGENVSVAEVEAIMNGHPEIAECAAVGVASPVGEQDIKLVVVCAPGQSLSPPAIRDFAEREMARFMVPRYVEIMDALPRTDVGKVHLSLLTHLGDRVWDAEAPV
ncbi:AMP-binding protein [Sphingopyxis fribergensis]